jgi:hypothetical protein
MVSMKSAMMSYSGGGHFSLPLTNITHARPTWAFSSCAAAIGRTFAGSAQSIRKQGAAW